MSGLLGGYLGLVEIVGGAVGRAVLYVLIGKKALKLENREADIIFGGLLVGLVAGVLSLALLPDFDPPFDSIRWKLIVAFGGSALGGLTLALVAESLSKELDRKKDK